MDLQDKRWKKLTGGSEVPYDVSVPLIKLEKTEDPEEVKKIWEELWQGLHHQGRVGLASYLAIPQMVRIAREKKLADWNLFGLCSLIEQKRHEKGNPDLPASLQMYYQEGLTGLAELALMSLQEDQEDTTFVTALSAVTVGTGRVRLANAIMQLEDEKVLEEFLEQF